jgi:hypothetical protein
MKVRNGPSRLEPGSDPGRDGGGARERSLVASAPELLTLATHRDRRHWWQSVWVRRVLLVLPTALVVLALLNTFGQRPHATTATAPEARLTVVAPVHARSGLIYAARFQVDAIRELKKATLILAPGWADGYTVNGQAPQPLTQGSDDGKLDFGFGHVPAGKRLTFWVSLQINPTTIGRHRQDVSLYDGSSLIASVHRTVTIFP